MAVPPFGQGSFIFLQSEVTATSAWLYFRFNLSHRDIEDLLAERGITVSRDAIILWCIKFGALYVRRLKRKHRGYGDTFYNEVYAGKGYGTNRAKYSQFKGGIGKKFTRAAPVFCLKMALNRH